MAESDIAMESQDDMNIRRSLRLIEDVEYSCFSSQGKTKSDEHWSVKFLNAFFLNICS